MEAFLSEYASGLLKDLLEKLNSLVIHEAGQVLQFDGKEDREKLEQKLWMANTKLLRLPTNNFCQPRVGDVTRVCYDAEDLVDDILLSASNTSKLEWIKSLFSRGSMARKIPQLLQRLDDIIEVLDMLHEQAHQGSYSEVFGNRRRPVSLPQMLFGRDEDKKKIINMLLQSTTSSISIVGIGGLGKTALCYHVSYDPSIQGAFDDIVRVAVNGRFNLIEITKSILNIRGESQHSFLPEVVQRSIQDRYMGKNVLILLDDLLDVEHKEWSEFSSLFSNSCSCKFLLTTTNLNVAEVTISTPYHLQMLTVEDCQALIIDKAHSSNNLSQCQLVNLKDVAKAMAQKCKGLPLAADILGLFLSSRGGDDNGDWMTLFDKDICKLNVYRKEIFPVFRLKNPDLPSHLKKCFAYCSLFPYEYNFKKDNMVQLWMAEGYLHPRSLECHDCNYFDELLWRSIFQLSQLGNEETPIYKMHEFIHKFARLVASNTCYQFEKDEWSCSVPWNKKPRHFSLLCDSINLLFFKKIEKCETLRTLLLLNERGTQVGQVPYSLFQKLERLRVLDLSYTDIVELPESLGKLKHLRYLNVSKTHISRLPVSASNLHGLEVLKLRDCSELLELPKNLKNLTNLIHLDVDINGLRSMPQSIGNLSYLQTLRTFIIGKKDGYRITELKNLKDLEGTICLFNLQKVRDGSEAKEASIYGKRKIKRLKLVWSRFSRNESKAMDVLVGLQPHTYLKELHVINYGGSSFPPWLTSTSFQLVRIHLQNCRQYDVLPSLGQLPFLKTLHIEGMYRVKYVDRHFCGESSGALFPSLKSLKIQNMECLELWNELPECSMPQLCHLTVEECPILFSIHSLHHMTSLQALEINRCPRLNSLPELPVSIKSLIIFQSDLVKQRCHRESGPQWCIISSIPKVVIDGDQVMTTDESI